jgi:hypothetical protein
MSKTWHDEHWNDLARKADRIVAFDQALKATLGQPAELIVEDGIVWQRWELGDDSEGGLSD